MRNCSKNARAAEAFPYGFLFWEMTRTQFLLRDQGTALGFFWTLMHPLLMFAVLYALFIKWVGRFVNQYAAYLLVGLVLWNFFQKATSSAVGSLRRSRGLVLNYIFPREIIVLSAVGVALFTAALEAGLLMALLPFFGQPIRQAWLFLPVLIGCLACWVSAVALQLAAWGARYQDMERIWEVLCAALFYLTPVFYHLDMLESRWRGLLAMSPLAYILTAFRACAIEGRMPAWPCLGLALGLGAAAAAGSLWAFRRQEQKFADRLLV
ncbi:MAG: ABC transporter permease [Elusimicrobia bacterium]|nr:ABC transporter permease [Elusimicrobiota bacterium]